MSIQLLVNIHSVKFIDNCWQILQAPGEMHAIKLAGSPVLSFASGWHPRILVDFGLDIHILELTHENGQKATWFLDKTYNHMTDRVNLLPIRLQEDLLKFIIKQVKFVYDNLLLKAEPDFREEECFTNHMNECILRQFIDLLRQQDLFPCRVVRERLFDHQTISVWPTKRLIELKYLDRMFQMDLRHSVEDALRSGYLCCPSPVNGAELRSYHSLVINEQRMAFRFIDPVHDLVFYLSTTHDPKRVADIYIPAAESVFTTLSDNPITPNSTLVAEYLTHFVSHSREIIEYIRNNQRIPAVVCRGFPGMHIGHQLWNELTAYERLAKNLDKDHLPTIIVPNAQRGSEAYGPLDILFPEWNGKIDRSLQTETETLGEYVYRKGYLLFRALDQYVSASLSDRLMRFAYTNPLSATSRTQIAELKREGFTLVTLGLRVENRTAVNLYEVFEHTITYIASRIPKLAVVIDGHNSRLSNDLTTTFDSAGQTASSAPVLAELSLAIRLRQRFEYTNIKLINIIGCSVMDSIVWTQASSFFISVWGAGLAKYRWACNQVGFVISNQMNLLLRHDLHIYDSPEFQENPSPILYIDPMSVTDCPESPVLFLPSNSVPGSYANFHVDCAKLLSQIERLLEMADVHSGPILLKRH